MIYDEILTYDYTIRMSISDENIFVVGLIARHRPYKRYCI